MENKPKKRILIFSLVYLPKFVGGAEIAIKEITDRLEEFEFDMVTLRGDNKSLRFEKVGNINVHRIGGSVLWINKYLMPFTGSLKAKSLIKENKYDCIWSVMASYNSFAALFTKNANPRIPWLLTLQEGDSLEHIKRRARPVWPVFKKIFKKADKVQTISHFLADFAKEMGAKDIDVVPNGVDVSLFEKIDEEKILEWKNKLGKKDKDIFLVTASRLVEKNAVGDIISSLAYLPENIKFVVAGVGKLQMQLKFQIKNLGLEERVKFLGFTEQKDLPALFKACNIFVRPSLSEGFGNSFVEAMAARIPVIATPVGGIVDFIKDEQTGFFVEVKDPESIAREVKYILENKDITEQAIQNASAMVKNKYDWSIVAEEMGDIFTNM